MGYVVLFVLKDFSEIEISLRYTHLETLSVFYLSVLKLHKGTTPLAGDDGACLESRQWEEGAG